MTDTFERLEESLREAGPLEAVERLCDELREQKDFHGLFYALLLRKRWELGLPPIQAGGGDNIPADKQEAYEEAIRLAARAAGQLYLDQGDVIHAWPFYRMIGESGPVAAALERLPETEEGDGETYQQLVDIALHQGAHPKKGFDMAVKRYGLCSAITLFGQGLQVSNEVREHCIQRLVLTLYEELQSRLLAEVRQRPTILVPGQEAPADDETKPSLTELIGGRDWLFEDEAYHIDTSHLSAIVQFSINLPPGPELEQAIELCEYGKRLSPRLQYAGDPPFENQFADYQVYLKALAGREVEEAIAHFRAKAADANPDDAGTFPAQVLVNLLGQLNRPGEAVDAYVRFLANADARQLACPSLQELCEKAGDYRPLVEVSRRRGDLVNFTAGLLQARDQRGQP